MSKEIQLFNRISNIKTVDEYRAALQSKRQQREKTERLRTMLKDFLAAHDLTMNDAEGTVPKPEKIVVTHYPKLRTPDFVFGKTTNLEDLYRTPPVMEWLESRHKGITETVRTVLNEYGMRNGITDEKATDKQRDKYRKLVEEYQDAKIVLSKMEEALSDTKEYLEIMSSVANVTSKAGKETDNGSRNYLRNNKSTL